MITKTNENSHRIIEFTATEASDIANLPTNVPSGSTCVLITTAGLQVYMFRQDGLGSGQWIAI